MEAARAEGSTQWGLCRLIQYFISVNPENTTLSCLCTHDQGHIACKTLDFENL
ncbi:MAG: hypothetical protein ACLR0U_27705 [Enterocloster clostridioformis]